MSIKCPFCSREFAGDKLNARHLSKCNPALQSPVLPCLCGHEATSLTQMKRHRKVCGVWKGRDVEAVAQSRREDTNLERFGVADASQAPEVAARRKATTRERYGADNVFSRDSSLFDRVRENAVHVGLSGAANPFSKPEVQAKIRATNLARYGAENPQQVQEVRERTQATNLERYGVEEVLASPEVRAQIRATCEDVYGGPAPSCHPEVLERARQTNLERFGVPWTCMDPEVRRKQLETHLEHYGAHFFASEEGKEIVRAAMLENHGVLYPSQIKGWWTEEVHEKRKATSRERFGAEHWMKIPENFLRAMAASFSQRGMNGLERVVFDMCPPGMIEYTGNRKFWKWLPKLGAHKNPDFVVRPFSTHHKVVEVFGDFWHSRMFTGKAPFEHEQELIEAFAEEGVACLVVWESEVHADPERVKARILEFAGVGEPDPDDNPILDLFGV